MTKPVTIATAKAKTYLVPRLVYAAVTGDVERVAAVWRALLREDETQVRVVDGAIVADPAAVSRLIAEGTYPGQSGR